MILLKQRVRLSLKPRQRTPRLRLRRRLWIRKQNPRFHHDHEPRATTRLVGEIQENKVALETPNTPPRAGSLLPWSTGRGSMDAQPKIGGFGCFKGVLQIPFFLLMQFHKAIFYF